MGIFGNFFGKKKPSSVRVSLGQAQPFLEKELLGQKTRLLDLSAKKLAEIRHVLRETNASLEDFGKAELSGQNTRLKKIVETAKGNALPQLQALLEKIEPPNTSDLAAIRAIALIPFWLCSRPASLGKTWPMQESLSRTRSRQLA